MPQEILLLPQKHLCSKVVVGEQEQVVACGAGSRRVLPPLLQVYGQPSSVSFIILGEVRERCL